MDTKNSQLPNKSKDVILNAMLRGWFLKDWGDFVFCKKDEHNVLKMFTVPKNREMTAFEKKANDMLLKNVGKQLDLQEVSTALGEGKIEDEKYNYLQTYKDVLGHEEVKVFKDKIDLAIQKKREEQERV